MKIHTAAALFAACTAACQEERQDSTALRSETTDSAGIEIIENARPPDDSRLGWRIGPEPAVSIGRVEGDDPYLLHGVSDAMMLGDGRIVVANSGTQELRVFNESGTHLATWGGEGEGPGEFSWLGAIEPWPGDSIIAWYGPRRDISVFGADGNYGRGFTFEANDDEATLWALVPQATTRNGLILAMHDPHLLITVTAEVRDSEGRRLSSLGSYPGQEMAMATATMADAILFSVRLPRTTWGDLFVIGPTDRYELKAFTDDGTLARIVRRGHEPRTVTRAHIDAHVEEILSPPYPDDWTESEIASYLVEERQRYRVAPVVEHFPAFASLMTDALDHLWVEEYEIPGEERPGVLWTVFDPEGRVLGFVETAEGLEVYEIGEDYILGRATDELGVEFVQVWPLDRPGR
ncbi:MAG: hypothetical protein OXQ94_00315 [Gemmatimonadota bacterium]|nr:hypothetical protein [Gemmatimonadota bacterium]MDE2870124.1 hypothetical protein [Gemmatimonadota bacterium]